MNAISGVASASAGTASGSGAACGFTRVSQLPESSVKKASGVATM